jgi:DNA-binding transcriptional LysR family regulator
VAKDLDTRLLRAFILTAREGNLSRAAERMLISQQGLSRQIQRLESLTGNQLFVRSGAGMALSEAGERLLLGCSRISAPSPRRSGWRRSATGT